MKKNIQQNSKKTDSKKNSKKNAGRKSSKTDSLTSVHIKPKSNLRKWGHKHNQGEQKTSNNLIDQRVKVNKIKIAPEHLIYGRHASFACMGNSARIFNHIYISESFLQKHNAEFHRLIRHMAINEDIVQVVNRKDIQEVLGEDAVHNGIICDVNPLLELDISDLIVKSKTTENYAIGILDEAMDPQNIGAILRSASAFGIKAIVIPKRNSPMNTASLAKSASGALEVVDIIRIGNMKSTLEQLKEHDFWIIGLSAGDNSTSLKSTRLDGKIAFVFGAEGRGLRDLTVKTCDVIAHIPIHRSMESLNLSNAGAITFYEWYSRIKS